MGATTFRLMRERAAAKKAEAEQVKKPKRGKKVRPDGSDPDSK